MNPKVINRVVVGGSMFALGVNAYLWWAERKFTSFYGIPEKYFNTKQLAAGYQYNPFAVAGTMALLTLVCFFMTAVKENKGFQIMMGVISVGALMACIAICLSFGNVSNKKVYGITEQGTAVVGEYKGSLVTKNCKTDGKALVLQKDVYNLEKKENATIVYHTYKTISFVELV